MLVYKSVCVCRPGSISSQGAAPAQRRRLYSAVPGRVFVATRSHTAQGEREISLNKGDKVKGVCLHANNNNNKFEYCAMASDNVTKCVCVCISVCFLRCG